MMPPEQVAKDDGGKRTSVSTVHLEPGRPCRHGSCGVVVIGKLVLPGVRQEWEAGVRAALVGPTSMGHSTA